MKYQKYLIFIISSIFLFNCSGPIIHKVIDTFEDGTIKTLSVFKGSCIIQKIECSSDGNILNRSFYRNDCLFGKWISGEFFDKKNLVSNYYGNGVLKSKGHLINDNMHGHWSHYDRDGKLESNSPKKRCP